MFIKNYDQDTPISPTDREMDTHTITDRETTYHNITELYTVSDGKVTFY